MNKITLLFVLLWQIGLSQNYTEYTTGSTLDVDTGHAFGICMMGGASESDEAMVWFLNKTNGGDVVVLRASGSDGYNNYMYSELGVTINSVTTFVIHNENGATDPHVLDVVSKAEGIWFAGGDQYDYASFFKDNALEDVINEFINTKRGVIGGTSAGMAILGNHYFDASNGTITNAQALANPYDSKVSLGYNDFLSVPFLEHVITDTHYDDPDRKGRHSVFLARFAQDFGLRSFGIACNEYTAVCIDQNGRARVYGDYPNYEEYAYFLQANCTSDYAPETCEDGSPLTWNKNGEAIKVYKVPGMTTGENYFELSDWTTGSGGSWENWYIQNGNFQSTATTNPGCDLLSVMEEEITKVDVFPNPFKSVINIRAYSEFDAQLFDVNGKEITIRYNAYNQINAEELSVGIYFLKLNFGNEEQTIKLIKE